MLLNINNGSKATLRTKKRLEIMWVKEDIEYLYGKKIELNKELYRSHLVFSIQYIQQL